MVGMGPEELSQHRVRSCVDPLRRGHCSSSGSGFAPDWLSYGTLRPLLSSSGMDHRHPWFLVGEPDPNSSRDCPDRRVGRLASHSGPQNEDRSPSRGHEIDSGLVPNEVRLVPVTAVNASVVDLERVLAAGVVTKAEVLPPDAARRPTVLSGIRLYPGQGPGSAGPSGACPRCAAGRAASWARRR